MQNGQYLATHSSIVAEKENGISVFYSFNMYAFSRHKKECAAGLPYASGNELVSEWFLFTAEFYAMKPIIMSDRF